MTQPISGQYQIANCPKFRDFQPDLAILSEQKKILATLKNKMKITKQKPLLELGKTRKSEKLMSDNSLIILKKGKCSYF